MLNQSDGSNFGVGAIEPVDYRLVDAKEGVPHRHIELGQPVTLIHNVNRNAVNPLFPPEASFFAESADQS